jgi:hypothetical protein
MGKATPVAPQRLNVPAIVVPLLLDWMWKMTWLQGRQESWQFNNSRG